MKSLNDKIIYIDELRKKAMCDSNFVDMAKEHEKAITQSLDSPSCKKISKRLSEIYSDFTPESHQEY